jgi:hypothetical protein
MYSKLPIAPLWRRRGSISRPRAGITSSERGPKVHHVVVARFLIAKQGSFAKVIHARAHASVKAAIVVPKVRAERIVFAQLISRVVLERPLVNLVTRRSSILPTCETGFA